MEKSTIKKIAVVGVVVALVVAFFAFDLRQYLTLSYIKESQEKFQALYAEHQAAVIAAYMAIYILVTSLSLPGAAVMTLAGGAMFGLMVGTIVVSFASTIGATIACVVSRFVLRDWVQAKVGDRLKSVNEGIEREGAFYLFTMRLIPAIPFWLINLTMGLTRMRMWTFYWVSQVGMLAGTIVYVNAGKEIARIESPSGILSPRLIGSFVLLGLFPITAKKLLALYRRKKGKEPIEEITQQGGRDG
ncbi:MAG: TVP38/TMEM64 family protein [Armatimonadetes bacterium]|nr:TVP38/TMEM64 family protein [Armatimonadota bacterium]NIO97650.1 TVP38/TMEM64 family protein [Armatimonadota bacterium]